MKFLKFWFPVILYSGIIFWASSRPNLSFGPPLWGFDKFLHVFEYSGLGFLTARAIKNETGWSGKKLVLFVMVCTCFYGITDEIHQHFVPGRRVEFFDIVADSIGGLTGSWLFLKLVSIYPKKGWL